MDKTKISIVSYLNSRPFLYGLKKFQQTENFELSLDIPSKIVAKLTYGIADVGLIPVAGLEDLNEYHLLSDYCIGADGKVRTVVLASDVPLEEVDTVLMDYQSRTSVLLAKILAKFFWKRKFRWENTCADFENKSIGGKTAGVLIGDRVFAIEERFKYMYDLSEEWKKFTGLPIVFAVWAANKKLPKSFNLAFNEALAFGLEKMEEAVKMEQKYYPKVNISSYLKKNISFEFNDDKKAGMTKFLELAKQLEPVGLL